MGLHYYYFTHETALHNDTAIIGSSIKKAKRQVQKQLVEVGKGGKMSGRGKGKEDEEILEELVGVEMKRSWVLWCASYVGVHAFM